jgi:hypothetical protein
MISRQVFKSTSVRLGAQTPVNMDYLKFPFQATVNADLVSGTIGYQLEYTTDDINGAVDVTTLRWLPLTQVLTASLLLQATVAVTAIRANITSLTGELRLAIIQGTSGG